MEIPVNEREILKRRARELSRPAIMEDAVKSEDHLYTGFILGRQSYCLRNYYVREVLFLKDLTVIPGIPPFIQGVINVRGRVIALVNLLTLFQITETGINPQNRIIIVSHQGFEAGFLVDSITGTFRMSASDISPAEIQWLDRSSVKGIAANGMIVLDAGSILEDKRLIINEL